MSRISDPDRTFIAMCVNDSNADEAAICCVLLNVGFELLPKNVV